MKKAHLTILLCLLCCQMSAQHWTVNYREGFPNGHIHFNDGFLDQEGVTFLSGSEGPDYTQPQLLLMRINPDGTHCEFHYQKADSNSKGTCIIEMADHHLFVAGNLLQGDCDSLLVLILDKDLNLLQERHFGKSDGIGPYGNCKAILDPYGNIIVSSTTSFSNDYGGTDDRGVFFKFNADGELINQQLLIADYPDPLFYFMDFNLRQMWYHQDTETLLCLAPGRNNVMSFIAFDSAFHYIEDHPIWRDDPDKSDHTLFRDCYTDHWYSDEEALVFSSRGDAEHNKLRISVVNTQGSFEQFIRLNERQDTIDEAARYRCMAKVNDSLFYFSFYSHPQKYLPGISCVYLINDQLEIIGHHVSEDHDRYRAYMIFATDDGGCITVNDSCPFSGTATVCHPVIQKLMSNDFEAITLSTTHSVITITHPTAYPNPTNTFLNIPLTIPLPAPLRCQVFDGQGRVISDRKITGDGNTVQVDVSQLPPGIYCYRIQQNDRTLQQERFQKK